MTEILMEDDYTGIKAKGFGQLMIIEGPMEEHNRS